VVEPENVESVTVDTTAETVARDAQEEMTPEERRKLARLRDMFKAVEYEEPAPV
jgi:hypothetical protein